MPVPDSGMYASIGFAQQAKLPFEMGLIRNHYVGRTFIQPTQVIRDFRVKVKLNPIKDVLKNKEVLVIEDSIVRGTTSRVRVKTLRLAGAKKVCMHVSCPPLKFPCFYGIDFPTRRELIASSRSIKEIQEYIGVDELKYLSLEGMLKSMLLEPDEFCIACFTGKYPTKLPPRISKTALEKFNL
jgi:amidophosphoribosyltransferase